MSLSCAGTHDTFGAGYLEQDVAGNQTQFSCEGGLEKGGIHCVLTMMRISIWSEFLHGKKAGPIDDNDGRLKGDVKSTD